MCYNKSTTNIQVKKGATLHLHGHGHAGNNREDVRAIVNADTEIPDLRIPSSETQHPGDSDVALAGDVRRLHENVDILHSLIKGQSEVILSLFDEVKAMTGDKWDRMSTYLLKESFADTDDVFRKKMHTLNK